MRITLSFVFSLFIVHAFAQGPEITSWIINTDGSTGYGNLPSNVQQVAYTETNVYINATSIPSYEIGPWPGNPNIPTNQDFNFIITRTPVENTGTDVVTSMGQIGVWKNGVVFFNPKDAFSYNNQNVWYQNAIVVEAVSFDECLGHPGPDGTYHTHLNPACLYDYTDGTQHAPLLGYAFDGFPIYGGYGYDNPDGTGGIVRMEPSYQLRDIDDRTTLADGTVLNSNQYGPAINNQYPLGYYLEDFEYIEDLGHLDEHNGRWCVTPEYPNGTYCYFATITAEYEGAFPYTIGPTYYGTVQNGNAGPNGGNVTVPGNATIYNTTSTVELSQDQVVIRTTENAWIAEGISIETWELMNTSGQLVSVGMGNEISNEMLVTGIYFLAIGNGDQSAVIRLAK